MGVSRKSLTFLFVVFFATQPSQAWAGMQVKEIFQLASDICSKIESAGMKEDALGESGISDRIKEYLSRSKLMDAAIQTIGDAQYYANYFIQRAKQTLETELESDQFSFQKCRTELVNILVEDTIKIQDAEDDDRKFSTCRHSSHGIVRRQRVEIFDRYSGWVWGGRDPRWWCARFMDVLSHQYPDAKYKVLQKRERVKKRYFRKAAIITIAKLK